MNSFKLSLGLLTLLLVSISFAAVPQQVNFQGRLTNTGGTPLANDTLSVEFKIYDASVSGNVKWSETDTITTDANGTFTILLGAKNPIPDSVFNDSLRWLGIKVGADPEITPRQRLASVGYSYQSGQWSSSGNNIYRDGGNVGIGTSTPLAKLGVVASSGFGVYASGSPGVYGVGGGGTGVYGEGSLYGLYGNSNGTGVYGSSSSNYGVYGTSSSGTGVYCYGGGFAGLQASGSPYGVYAYGGTSGVYGYTSTNGGHGVFGWNGGNSLTWAGYFQGDTRVTGNLSVDGFIFKNGGGFKIDHPIDPANKYLYHSFVESPDMKNIYDGVTTTDAKGEATVTLPDWFGAVNKDFRYQLTAIGQFAQAIVSKEISNNQFSIQTDKPNVKVSWLVTGIRKDAYAEAHRIPVEEAKSGKELGKYLHPKEHGVSEALGMNYEMTQKMEAERKQMEEQKAKMEQELKGTDKK